MTMEQKKDPTIRIQFYVSEELHKSLQEYLTREYGPDSRAVSLVMRKILREFLDGQRPVYMP